MSKSKRSAIDSLKDGAPAPASSPIDSLKDGEVETGPPALAYVVFYGKCGPHQTFASQGLHLAFMDGQEPLKLHPGLNIRPAAMVEAHCAHGQTATRVAEDHISFTDENLRGHTSPPKLRKLAEATEDPDALEWLCEREMAKPVNGKRGEVRDSKLLGMLQYKLARASHMPQIDVHDIESVAGAQASIAPAT